MITSLLTATLVVVATGCQGRATEEPLTGGQSVGAPVSSASHQPRQPLPAAATFVFDPVSSTVGQLGDPKPAVAATASATTRSAAKGPPPTQRLNNDWEYYCYREMCSMITAFVRADPDHPPDPSNPEHVQVEVWISKIDRRALVVFFHVPPNADPRRGLVIAFARTKPTADGCFHEETDADSMTHLPFSECIDLACTVEVAGGLVHAGKAGKQTELLREFLAKDRIMFLYERNGEPYTAYKSLDSFHSAYKKLMKREFK
jgi:hypothetical protein